MTDTTLQQTVRDTIIKTPSDSPGLIVADGRQYPFEIAGLWLSPTAPEINQTVEVELAGDGSIKTIRVVNTHEATRERFDQLTGIAGERGREAATIAKSGFDTMVKRMGKPKLITAVVLVFAWLFLTSVAFKSPYGGGTNLSFWDLSDLFVSGIPGNAPLGSHGILSFIGLLCIAAPFLAPFWKNRRAQLLNVLPLAFVIMEGIRISWAMRTALDAAVKSSTASIAFGFGNNSNSSAMADSAVQDIVNQFRNLMSVEFGCFVVVVAAIVLAVFGLLAWMNTNYGAALG